jgi:hypothetical protein
MQIYVAEIDGLAIFAFRAVDIGSAQAWLDVHAVMRHALERIRSGGRCIWNGQAQIIARKANGTQATVWNELTEEVAAGQIGEADSITVWLIPTSDVRRDGNPPQKLTSRPRRGGSRSSKLAASVKD